ncbi:hypothetical protein HMI54_013943, partial [Coelomomyces lativittatus]
SIKPRLSSDTTSLSSPILKSTTTSTPSPPTAPSHSAKTTRTTRPVTSSYVAKRMIGQALGRTLISVKDKEHHIALLETVKAQEKAKNLAKS